MIRREASTWHSRTKQLIGGALALLLLTGPPSFAEFPLDDDRGIIEKMREVGASSKPENPSPKTQLPGVCVARISAPECFKAEDNGTFGKVCIIPYSYLDHDGTLKKNQASVGKVFFPGGIVGPIVTFVLTVGTLGLYLPLNDKLKNDALKEETTKMTGFLESRKCAPEMESMIRELESRPETRKTSSGAVFTKVPQHPALGKDVWSDPSGLVWGRSLESGFHVYITPNHSPNQAEVARYCASTGARLPSREEVVRLATYMGGNSTDGGGAYRELLGLDETYWTSTDDERDPGRAYVFNWTNRDRFFLDTYTKGYSYRKMFVLCVADHGREEG